VVENLIRALDMEPLEAKHRWEQDVAYVRRYTTHRWAERLLREVKGARQDYDTENVPSGAKPAMTMTCVQKR
jgi:trehalose-6-phosphate synthase